MAIGDLGPLSAMVPDDETAKGALGGSDDAGDYSAAAPLSYSYAGIPGAGEAFQRMIKSNEEARAALQRARESIAARKWDRAQALLAMSAAFGTPTRTGSFSESLANVANAVRQPLAERQTLERDKTKELLGIDTQIAGLDQSTAKAQLDLAALNAKLTGDRMKTPNELVRSFDASGKPKVDEKGAPVYEYAAPWDARGKEGYARPGTNVNVGNAPQNKLADVMAEKLGPEYSTMAMVALKAPQQLMRANEIDQLLDKVPYTGAGADWKLKAGKVARVFGWDYAKDDVKNTELLVTKVGQDTLDAIHGSGLGTGQGFTDKDLLFLKGVTGGDIALDGDTLRELARIHRNVARASADRWNHQYDLIEKGRPGTMVQLGLEKIFLPKEKDEGDPQGESAPAAGDTTEPPAGAEEAPTPEEIARGDFAPAGNNLGVGQSARFGKFKVRRVK